MDQFDKASLCSDLEKYGYEEVRRKLEEGAYTKPQKEVVQRWLDGKDQLRDTYVKIDEEYRVYRQSGLGISATIITLSLLLLKVVAGKVSGLTDHYFFLVVWGISLLAAVVLAVLIQFFHYLGYQAHAVKYFFPPGKDGKKWFRDKRDTGNCLFKLGERALIFSLSLLAVGFISSVYLWICAEVVGIPTISTRPDRTIYSSTDVPKGNKPSGNEIRKHGDGGGRYRFFGTAPVLNGTPLICGQRGSISFPPVAQT